MTFREFAGKNVEQAIRAAMREFAADLSDLDIEILSQGSRGILGVGGEEARILAAPKSAVAAAETVREAPEPPAAAADAEPPDSRSEEELADDQAAELARAATSRGGRGGGRDRFATASRGGGVRERRERPPRAERAPRPARSADAGGERPAREPIPFIPAKPLDELSDTERAVLQEAKAVLEELLRLMGIESTVEVVLGTETAKLNVRGDDLGVLIGRRGEKLSSLQHLVNLIVAKREGQTHRIAVDIENYRGRREDQLRDVAERAAQRVVQTGKIIQLEPMPAVERRIVHLALVENPKVRTQSVGVEPTRRIVILPATRIDA